MEQSQNENPDEITIEGFVSSSKSWFSYILKKWWILGIVGIIGGLLGIWVAYLDTPKYESKLTFALDDGGTDGGGGMSNIAAQFGLNLGGSGRSFFAGDNILEIMKSRRIIEAVLLSTDTINGQNKKLIQHYLDFDKAKKTTTPEISFPLNLDKSQFSYQQDSLLLEIATLLVTDNLVAEKPDKKLDIYEIKVTSKNENFTKIFTERVLQETTSFYTELRSKKGRETLNILEQRVASMKGDMNASITTRSAIQDANINPAFAAAQTPLYKQTANIQVYSGAYAELFKHLEMARIQYLKEIPLLQIIDNVDYPMKKIKKGKLLTGIELGFVAVFFGILMLTYFGFFGNSKNKILPNRSI